MFYAYCKVGKKTTILQDETRDGIDERLLDWTRGKKKYSYAVHSGEAGKPGSRMLYAETPENGFYC